MAKTIEIIPVYKPPTEFENSVGASLVWRAVTHRGLVRLHNEDSFCTESKENSFLFAIADGLGGHRGGAVASKVAIDTLKSEFQNWNGKGTQRFVNKAMMRANEEVAQWYPGLSKMQTTMTIMAFEPNLLVLGHVGDCRCYRLRNGNLNLLTKDQTVASDLIRLKLILPKYSSQHPGRHQLTRSLGSNILLRSDVMKEKFDSGDSFLLCSDGVWSNLNHDDIKKALLENKIDESLEHVLEKPLDCGAHDNITAILIRIK